ncbi:MAG: DUF4007 family protein [Candidatus Competibacteraceae bacterium]|nr:DUF4007 family protein [Candidatus Competibacteraceae bacterium]
MQFNRIKTSFGRHETFPLRYGWLTKGLEAIRRTPDLLTQPESAMIALGVGRNMVNALQYWLGVTGIVEFKEGMGAPTALGETLLGAAGDAYLEDEATLWIVHWLMAANAELATGFYWFFNHFASPSFQDQDVLYAIGEFAERELKIRRAQTTLKSDISTLLRMYAPTAGRNDEHLDSPLAQLQLIIAESGHGYRSPRIARPFLPPIALHFALAQRFAAEPRLPALPIRAILYGGDDWPAPGAVFRLSEEGLMNTLEQVMERYPESYELRDTAGVHQLYRRGGVIDPLAALRSHYQRVTA